MPACSTYYVVVLMHFKRLLSFFLSRESTVQSLMSQTAVQLEWSALRILKNRGISRLFLCTFLF